MDHSVEACDTSFALLKTSRDNVRKDSVRLVGLVGWRSNGCVVESNENVESECTEEETVGISLEAVS